MDIAHFFQSIPDKVSKFFFPNQILENILILKTVVILVALSLLISSLALLILALSHHRFKKYLKLIKPNTSPKTLSQNDPS